jgi:hypothetical protein
MKITSIAFDVYFHGQGIVNRNGSRFLRKENGADIYRLEAKSYPHLPGEDQRKPVVTRNCILHEVLAEPHGFKFIAHIGSENKVLSAAFSECRMLRGYMITAKASKTLTRKSSLYMLDAMPTKECSYIYVENSAKGGMEGYFEEEKCGETRLRSTVSINLSDLQFISTDALGRVSINPEYFDSPNSDIIDAWEFRFPNTPFPNGTSFFFNGRPVDDEMAYATQGVKISDKDVSKIVIHFLNKLKQFKLEKRTGWLEYESIQDIKLHTDEGIHHIDTPEELEDLLNSETFAVNSLYRDFTRDPEAERIARADLMTSRAAAKRKSPNRRGNGNTRSNSEEPNEED